MSSLKKIITILILGLSLSGCNLSATDQKNMQASAGAASEVTLTSGSYENYSSERYKELLGSEKFILFFHADWCPTCRALEKEIKENLNKLNSRTILKVNYDAEAALKKEYGVMVQSTVVFINADATVFEKRVNPDFDLIEKFFY